jgi:hypothetical protein
MITVICFALVQGSTLCLEKQGEQYIVQCVVPAQIAVNAPLCDKVVSTYGVFTTTREHK